MWINLTEAQTQFLIKAGGKLQKEGVGKQERGVSIRAMAKLERAKHDSYREGGDMTKNKTFWIARGGKGYRDRVHVRGGRMEYNFWGWVEKKLLFMCHRQFCRTTGIKLNPGEQKKFKLVEVK